MKISSSKDVGIVEPPKLSLLAAQPTQLASLSDLDSLGSVATDPLNDFAEFWNEKPSGVLLPSSSDDGSGDDDKDSNDMFDQLCKELAMDTNNEAV